MRSALAGFLPALLVAATNPDLVADVRTLIAHDNFAAAEKQIAEVQSRSGASPEVVEAISWLSRGSLAAGKLDAADRYATESRTLALRLLRTRKLDSEEHLPLALGASIEIHAQVLAARGDRGQALEFLREQLAT